MTFIQPGTPRLAQLNKGSVALGKVRSFGITR
jgi:hypothetical protein